ncbi:hypothetical protein [Rhodococcus sp. SGAir0479]|uniref:hypothetical protein n=1 Tax=Rhodococcus sp. SGAir0479 TaxID=2567884 RepID=UPI001586B1F9|nr:hypothetical protein [Rhodococcus sp. SGAir0479]
MADEMYKLAWQMRSEGAGWKVVAEELGCAVDVVKLMVAQYESDTDARAAQDQFALFDV